MGVSKPAIVSILLLWGCLDGSVGPAGSTLGPHPGDRSATGRLGFVRDGLVATESKVSASDGAAGDYFAADVAGAGDVDGDGYDDLLVGVPGDDDDGSDSGSAYVYFGSASGPSATAEARLSASDGEAEAYFGGSVAGVGDIDGDGFDDVAIGAFGDDASGALGGSAYVYFGSTSGLVGASESKLTASDGSARDTFGADLAGAGDIDGDGFDDLLVGSPQADGGRGRVYLFSGASSGIDSASEVSLTASDVASGDSFGSAVSSAGDIDGDGLDDVIIGAYRADGSRTNSGSAYLYYGAASGIDTAFEHELVASDADDLDYYGSAVTGAGDLDGDGYADVAIGAYRDDDGGSSSGSVYVYFGSSRGVYDSSEVKLAASDAAGGDEYGFALAGAGDVDNDGFDDLVVGAYGDDDGGWSSGSAYVYFGVSSGIDIDSERKLTASDADADANFGYAVAGSGDLDGDDTADLVVGAWRDDAVARNSGAAYVYQGACSDLDGDGACAIDDCDDDDALTHPDATEVCDGLDNDCDGVVDTDAVDASSWYTDADADGYGDPSSLTSSCDPISGAIDIAGDCDDGDPSVRPGATEHCDGVDEDCDGVADDDAVDTLTWYSDGDGDGYGDPDSPQYACEQPAGTAAAGDDCDDGEPLAHTGAAELCDGVDNDCDGTADNDDALDAPTWYIDYDGDGHGSDSYTESACSQPDGYADTADDCDDTDATVHPGAEELGGDDIDQDCDGVDGPGAMDGAISSSDGCGGGCAVGPSVPPLIALLAVLLVVVRRRT